ncbi:MAG: TPM domain-containing protein, partial [Chitinophagaceae bacterium]
MTHMKRFLLVFAVILSLAITGSAQEFPARPNPPRLVNDITGTLLTAAQVKALEDKLVAYDDSTSNQIAVVIVDNLKGYSAADFALGIGRDWGVGNKQFDNGIVILLSTGGGAGNRDVFIAVGNGLEGVIPDLTADAIIDNELIPGLKSGNYYGGLNSTIDALISAAAGKYKAPDNYRKKKGKGFNPLPIIVLVIILISLFSRGGGGGGMMSRRGYTGWGGGFGGFGGGGFG